MKTKKHRRKQPRTKRPTRPLPTWRALVRDAFDDSPLGDFKLADLYEMLKDTPKAKANSHWKAKIRQVVQLDPWFERTNVRGTWKLKGPKPS